MLRRSTAATACSVTWADYAAAASGARTSDAVAPMLLLAHTHTGVLRWPSYALAILRCWQAISTGLGAGAPPPVHTATALTRRQSTWCSSVQLMTRPEETSGWEEYSTRTHNASGSSWSGLGRWPAPPRLGMRERGVFARLASLDWQWQCQLWGPKACVSPNNIDTRPQTLCPTTDTAYTHKSLNKHKQRNMQTAKNLTSLTKLYNQNVIDIRQWHRSRRGRGATAPP